MLSADKVLTTTRAVRRRLDIERPVLRAVVLDCVRIATQAPAGVNRSPLRWLLVDDAAVVSQAGELYRQAVIETSKTRRVRAGEERMYDSVDHLAEIMPRMPVLAFPYSKAPPPTEPLMHALTFWTSTVPAIWSMQLALRSRGLGSTMTTAHLMFAAEAADVLGLPRSYTQLGLLPIAYTVGVDFKPASRPPTDELVIWNHYEG